MGLKTQGQNLPARDAIFYPLDFERHLSGVTPT
jgi:hypothetical protein